MTGGNSWRGKVYPSRCTPAVESEGAHKSRFKQNQPQISFNKMDSFKTCNSACTISPSNCTWPCVRNTRQFTDNADRICNLVFPVQIKHTQPCECGYRLQSHQQLTRRRLQTFFANLHFARRLLVINQHNRRRPCSRKQQSGKKKINTQTQF